MPKSFNPRFSNGFGSHLNVATIAVKVGTGSGYDDGDLIQGWNRRAIRGVHAQHICHYRDAARNPDGFILLTHHSRDWFEATHQYRFERVSSTEVKRTDLNTLQEEIFSLTPNSKGEQIDVRAFIARRREQPFHYLFGADGSEVWYGGLVDSSDTKLDTVWNAIQTKTAHREEDYPDFPAGDQELKSHLFLRVNDMDDSEVEAMMASEVDNTDPSSPVILRKRTVQVPWQDLPDIAPHRNNILDKSVSVDIRPVVRKYIRGVHTRAKQ